MISPQLLDQIAEEKDPDNFDPEADIRGKWRSSGLRMCWPK